MLQRTTSQVKVAKMRKRVRILQGGTSSSKTFTIIPMLITYAIQKPGSEISIVGETIPNLRRGAIRDFLKIMEWTNNMVEEEWNRSTLTYNFPNGSFIEFFSADQVDKLRGPRRDVLFINEANNVTFEAYQQLAIRTRKFIYLDFNPSSEFWVHTELMGQDDADFCILTYKDNEALEPAIIKEIERAKGKAYINPNLPEGEINHEANIKNTFWLNWWRVYGLGQVGSLQGTVYDNWTQVDNIPRDAKYLGTGLDFGWQSPSAAVDLYIMNGEIYVDEVLYGSEIKNSDLVRLLRGKEVVADSAEPRTIHELRMLGLRIRRAEKGPGSKHFGIELLQEYTMHVTKSSTNVIRELRTYVWATDKTGKSLDEPVKENDHAMDALKYVASIKLSRKGSGSYSVL